MDRCKHGPRRVRRTLGLAALLGASVALAQTAPRQIQIVAPRPAATPLPGSALSRPLVVPTKPAAPAPPPPAPFVCVAGAWCPIAGPPLSVYDTVKPSHTSLSLMKGTLPSGSPQEELWLASSGPIYVRMNGRWQTYGMPESEGFLHLWGASWLDRASNVGSRIVRQNWIGADVRASDANFSRSTLRKIWRKDGGLWGVGSGIFYMVRDSAGSRWTKIEHPVGAGVEYTGISGSSDDDVWVVGLRGAVLRVKGKRASLQTEAVWGAAPRVDLTDVVAVGDEVWAVGAGGTALHYRGGRWQTESSGVSENLNALWAVSPTEVRAVGSRGVVLRWDGARFVREAAGSSDNLNAIADGFAVGDNNTILQLKR